MAITGGTMLVNAPESLGSLGKKGTRKRGERRDEGVKTLMGVPEYTERGGKLR